MNDEWYFPQGHNCKTPDLTRCCFTVDEVRSMVRPSFWFHRTFYWRAFVDYSTGKLIVTREKFNPKMEP